MNATPPPSAPDAPDEPGITPPDAEHEAVRTDEGVAYLQAGSGNALGDGRSSRPSMSSGDEEVDRPEDPVPASVDTDDPGAIRYWCEAFGVTLEQLQESVKAAGTDPQAVREHLLQQGSSAGAG